MTIAIYSANTSAFKIFKKYNNFTPLVGVAQGFSAPRAGPTEYNGSVEVSSAQFGAVSTTAEIVPKDEPRHGDARPEVLEIAKDDE